MFEQSEIHERTKWGRGDSNPHAQRHMILSHARLPIPTLPRVGESKLMLAHISLFPVGTLDPLQVKDRIILPDTSANEPGGV